jgi:transposase-like protein
MTDLSNPIFTDETAARKHLEAIRWPDGPVCPYCGTIEASTELGGESAGEGWYHCNACRKKYTVRVGSVYERSHIPLHKWVLATHLMCSSKKGISAHQLHRMLGITYKSAWFLAHRIREAMAPASNTPKEPLGGKGKIVEADETYIGRR